MEIRWVDVIGCIIYAWPSGGGWGGLETSERKRGFGGGELGVSG